MSKTYEATKSQPESNLEDARDGLQVIHEQFTPGYVPTAEQLDGVNLFLDEVANADTTGNLGGDQALQNSYNFARATADPGAWMLSQAETAKHEKVINAISKGHATVNRGKLARSREDDVDFMRELYSKDGNKLSRRQGLKLYRDWLQAQVDLSQELRQRELAKPTRDMHPKVRNEVLANLGATETKKADTKPAQEAEAEPDNEPATEIKKARKPFRQMTRDERGVFFKEFVKRDIEPKPEAKAKPAAEAEPKPEREKTGWRTKARNLGKSALTYLGITGAETDGSKNTTKASLADLLGGGEEIAEYVYSNGARHWYRVDENGNLLGQLKKADVEKYYDDQPSRPADTGNGKSEKSSKSKQKEEATKKRRALAALGLVAVASLVPGVLGIGSHEHNSQTSPSQNNKPNLPKNNNQTGTYIPFSFELGQILHPKTDEAPSVAQTAQGLKLKQARQNAESKAPELVVRAGDYPWDVLQRAGVPEGQIMPDLEQAGQAYEAATGNNVQWYGTGKHRWVKVNGQSDTEAVVHMLDNYLQR